MVVYLLLTRAVIINNLFTARVNKFEGGEEKLERHNLLQELGQRIHEARNNKHLTQEQLITQLDEKLQGRGFSRTLYSIETIKNWERGRYQPPIQCIIALSQILDTSLDYLISGKEFDPDNEIAELKTIYLRANPNLKSLFRQFSMIVKSLTEENN